MHQMNEGNDRNLHFKAPQLRIAQIAPLYERIPPKLYGGTERVVSFITEELVRRGHQVTLFASGDSLTGAKLVPGCAQSLRLIGKPELGRDPQLLGGLGLARHACGHRRRGDRDQQHRCTANSINSE